MVASANAFALFLKFRFPESRTQGSRITGERRLKNEDGKELLTSGHDETGWSFDFDTLA
jgi:hypothetical protein